MVGETKVQQVDDGLQTVLGAKGQGPIPQRPVVVAGFRLAQTPGHAVSDDFDAESGNRAKVVIDMGVVATLRKLVLAVRNSVGEDHRIGTLFSDGPSKVGE